MQRWERLDEHPLKHVTDRIIEERLSEHYSNHFLKKAELLVSRSNTSALLGVGAIANTPRPLSGPASPTYFRKYSIPHTASHLLVDRARTQHEFPTCSPQFGPINNQSIVIRDAIIYLDTAREEVLKQVNQPKLYLNIDR